MSVKKINEAIFYGLWPHNSHVLIEFVRHHKGITIFTEESFVPVSLKRSIKALGAHVVYLSDLYDSICNEQLTQESEKLVMRMQKAMVAHNVSPGKEGRERNLIITRDIINILAVLDSLKEEYKINFGIVNEQYTPLIKAIVLYLKAQKVPVLYLAHGAACSAPYTIHNVSHADVYMIGGRRFKESFKFAQGNKKKIVITGLPGWDKIITYPKTAKDIESWQHELTLNPSLPTVTFFTTWVGCSSWLFELEKDLPFNSLRLVLEAKKKLKGRVEFNLVIKDRPGADHAGFLDSLIAEIGLDASEVHYSRGSPESFVVNSDVVISVDSTISVEAIIAGTAPLNIPIDMSWLYGPIFGLGDGLVNLSRDNASIILEQLLTNEVERNNYIQNLRSNPDYYSPAFNGRAVKSVVQVMDGFMVSPDNLGLQNCQAAQRNNAIAFENIEVNIESLSIHFLVKVHDGDQALLADTVDSIAGQLNSNWRLTVIADFDAPNAAFDELDTLEWIKLEAEAVKLIGLAHVIADIQTDWVVWVKPGMCFEPYFISHFHRYMGLHPEWKFVYVDEVKVNQQGEICTTNFKPDFNLELLRSTVYMGELCLVNAASVKSQGSMVVVDAESYDLAFKIYEVYGEEAVGHIPETLLNTSTLYFNCFNREIYQRVLSDHLDRKNIEASIGEGLIENTFNVKYILKGTPKISILIEAYESMQVLEACLNSLVKKTDYPCFDIAIIVGEVQAEEVNSVVGRCENVSIQIVVKREGFSVINQWVKESVSEYLVFLNVDCQILQVDWLTKMLAYAQCDDVAIVSPRLVRLNETLHHAGLILGTGKLGVAGLSYYGSSMYEEGYQGRLQVVQNLSAVTGDCLLVDKTVFIQARGFDGDQFTSIFKDVDLCLKITALGYKIIWTPFVTLINHGASDKYLVDKKEKAKTLHDIDAMQKKWLPQLANDLAYNRNLSLKMVNFEVDTEINVTWNVALKDKPRVYAFPTNSTGVGEYRVRSPLRALTQADLIESSISNNSDTLVYPTPVEIERIKPEVLLHQNGFLDFMMEPWEKYRKFNDVFMVSGMDDLVYMLPHRHPMQGRWPKDLRRRLKKTFQLSDRLIVANDVLAEEFSKMADNVVVVPNYLETARWTNLVMPEKQNEKKLRVGWAGGSEHGLDLEFIIPVIKALHKEVDWVFMGMWFEEFEPYVKETHKGVPFAEYPQKLADLNLDLAIAPLMHNNFNEAKTNLRLLEFGIMGWPIVCTDITPYQNAPVTRVSNNVQQWINIIREKIREPEQLKKEGTELKRWVMDNYMLEDHLDDWYAALMP